MIKSSYFGHGLSTCPLPVWAKRKDNAQREGKRHKKKKTTLTAGFLENNKIKKFFLVKCQYA